MSQQEINCDNLRQYVQGFSLVEACDVTNNGMLRISTPFNYPNGSQIDLFLENVGNLYPDYILSDYGQTADYLADTYIKFWISKKRRQLVDDICRTLGVDLYVNRFQIRVKPDQLGELPNAMVRLAQACIRVADLTFVQRLQLIGTFQEDVEEFIAGIELPYESDLVLTGRYEREVKVDFRVKGQRTDSLIQTISTPNYTNAHQRALEVFSRWYDLVDYREGSQFVTLYDTSNDIFQRADLGRLHDVSFVFGYPDEKAQLQAVLVA
jgi:hypothetical protein